MNKKEIGEAVVVRRKTLKTSQAQLAKICGVSVHTLSNIETGEGNVTMDTLMKVAGTLGYQISIGL